MLTRALAVSFAVGLASQAHADGPTETRLHAELDPLPFARGGYGGQVGLRPAPLPHWRIAVASFSLDVPDAAVQLGADRDGFHQRVRPSAALYLLRYFDPSLEGWAVGGAMRYLRHELSHDDEGDTRGRFSELSPELIAGYKWQPFDAGFYLQPWVGLSAALLVSGERRVGERDYSPLPLQPFFTVNLGWQLNL